MEVFKSTSDHFPKLIEYIGCGNWRIRFNIQSFGELDKTKYKYLEFEMKQKPNIQDIKNVILDYCNKEIDELILSGFVWEGMNIWLSSENQFNYKAAYDLAIQTNGLNLPIIFKFGSSDNPVYYTFTTKERLQNFYMEAMSYINKTLNEGWIKKDSINWDVYQELL